MTAEGTGARLREVRARIAQTCARVGRSPESVQLLAVSKLQPVSAVREAYEAGQRAFGENYAQELVRKANATRDLPAIAWHLIGHLQRNKAKLVVGQAALVETVDSVKLMEALDRRASLNGLRLPVLVQVNVAGEAQKSGCSVHGLDDLLAEARRLEAVEVRGLMTVPPFSDDPEAGRPFFAQLRDLAGERGLSELSMGMSHDLEVAIEEGATIVRVGTAIFGPRPVG